ADALARREPAAAPPDLPVTTWGTPRDLRSWSGPAVAELAWRARRAELAVVAAGARASERAVRELLALQSSDWAFLVDRDLAAAYGHARSQGHRAALDAELRAPGSHGSQLRNLAPHASVAPLLA
ncbi:MAG TPA: 1,4-alpha-glucan branching protein domain-containing protein, partial [Solirubrobacteraceae bacterium]|nr:1,4-alpha-glucan branching protein domain-containing protein [Solirubrobacteraceae bacterium]